MVGYVRVMAVMALVAAGAGNAAGASRRSLRRLQKDFAGTWIANARDEIRITEGGICIAADGGDTLARLTVTAEDTLVMGFGDKEEAFRFAMGAGYFVVCDAHSTDMSIRKPDRAVPASEIRERIVGEWRLDRTLELALRGKSTETTEVNYVFAGDSVRVYEDGEVIDEGTYQAEDGVYIRRDYGSPHPRVVRFEDDTMLLAGLGKFVRRHSPFEKKPHLVAFDETVPWVTIHEVLPEDDVAALLDTVRAVQQPGDVVVTREGVRLLFDMADTASVRALLASERLRGFLGGYKALYAPYREPGFAPRDTMTACFIDTAAALHGSLIERVEVRKSHELGGHARFTMVLSAEGAEAFADLTEKSIGKHLAICVSGQLDAVPVVRDKITAGRFDLSPYWEEGLEWQAAWERYRKKHSRQ